MKPKNKEGLQMLPVKKNDPASPKAKKRPWKSLKLTFLGDAAQLIQQGGGKLSLAGGDTGESRKEKGND
jgi:hypothetical protein